MITVRVNGIYKEIEESMTIAQLLTMVGVKKESVVVEHNLQVVLKKDVNAIFLNDNDTIELVQFVGGG